MSWPAALNALLLLIVANLSPWAAARICGPRLGAPLDCGLVLWDGRRLLGDHKTWRGLVSACGACSIAAAIVRLPWSLGLEFALLSMAGDGASSALKRRMGCEPGREVLALDQLPEVLLPLIVLRVPLQLGRLETILTAVVFVLLDVMSTRVRHREFGTPSRK